MTGKGRIDMRKLGFIGMGNMGYAMMKGALAKMSPDEVIFSDADAGRAGTIHQETGVSFAYSNAECANQVKYLVLAVKPQFYDVVLRNIENVVTDEHIIISIAPSVSIRDLKNRLGSSRKIVRAMPNTPALVGEGMAGICYEENMLTQEEEDFVMALFSSFGRARVVDEKLMNAVTCASGSSPAYVYLFIEALADGAVKYGMPRQAAYEFAAQTVKGAAQMVLETGEHPGKLKDMVCSPGGTTIDAVEALEEFGFRNAVMKATDRCFEKCTAMQKKKTNDQ